MVLLKLLLKACNHVYIQVYRKKKKKKYCLLWAEFNPNSYVQFVKNEQTNKQTETSLEDSLNIQTSLVIQTLAYFAR